MYGAWRAYRLHCPRCQLKVDERTNKVLDLFLYEPDDTIEGSCAGKRHSGQDFKKEMKALLNVPGTEIITAIGKSTDKQHVDGNAIERLSFKINRFIQNPANKNRCLAIDVNIAFQRYKSRSWAEIMNQVAFFKTMYGPNKIEVLFSEETYRSFVNQLGDD